MESLLKDYMDFDKALKVLKLERGFTMLELKNTYHRSNIKLWHPDLAIHRGITKADSTRQTKMLIEAYESLLIKIISQSSNDVQIKTSKNTRSEYPIWKINNRNSVNNIVDEMDDFFTSKVRVESTYIKWVLHFPEKEFLLVRLYSSRTRFWLFNNIGKGDYKEILSSKSVSGSITNLIPYGHIDMYKDQVIFYLKKYGLFEYLLNESTLKITEQ